MEPCRLLLDRSLHGGRGVKGAGSGPNKQGGMEMEMEGTQGQLRDRESSGLFPRRHLPLKGHQTKHYSHTHPATLHPSFVSGSHGLQALQARAPLGGQRARQPAARYI